MTHVPVLSSMQRKLLDDACVQGRRASEQAVRAALSWLALTADRPPTHLGEEDRRLRRGLRAKARQLGDQGDNIDLLVAECAYEQWHRLLFARFLAESNLLIHPEYGAPVTLEECEELAASLGEPDGWGVASRFAAEILPGIFRTDDPCVQLRLAPEGRLALEQIVASLSAEVFAGNDALGWVYQYWQREQKDDVNRSERKVGGRDIGPVTQLFTENYMVRFLLENTLGAWWAARHPGSPLVKGWDYLRVNDAGGPLAGPFDDWPVSASEITVMDPCCGSGHFLVEAFDMLWRMRSAEEGTDPVTAQDGVLRDNLFGLELDPRCVQIAMFALALRSWKSGGGYRKLPVPNVACSGVPAKAPAAEWAGLAHGDARLASGLLRLHTLFGYADTLGSLIDPRRAVEQSESSGLQRSLEDVEWASIAPLLSIAMAKEDGDPATAVLGADAADVVRAASLLTRQYSLVATNVPYLTRQSQEERLRAFIDCEFSEASLDLATVFVARSRRLAAPGGCIGVVCPQGWVYQPTYDTYRQVCWSTRDFPLVALVGPGAFGGISGEVVNVALVIECEASGADVLRVIDVSDARGPEEKAGALKGARCVELVRSHQLRNPKSRLVADPRFGGLPFLSEFADSYYGTGTGDFGRFGRNYWEVRDHNRWAFEQGTVSETSFYAGRESVVDWSNGTGVLASYEGAFVRNAHVWGSGGVCVNLTGGLQATLYTGEIWDSNCAAVIPRTKALLPAVWSFISSAEFSDLVRVIDRSLKVMNHTLLDVPFDVERWTSVAHAELPDGLPQAWSNDPRQWLFEGRPEVATDSLQVGVARLLGYRWPSQPESDDLEALADDDGIVCLPSVRGEPTAGSRLQELLARAFGVTWSPVKTGELLMAGGSRRKDLDAWLREDFFKSHCQLFKNRPFIWQVWDGRKDGFSALLNYQRLDRSTLEKLTYSYLGDWIERQVAGVRDDIAGAEERLASARKLQQTLQLILDGEPPHDIYVRWKSLAEQPRGWEPDLNDGIRLNVRPFVEAGVLRAKFNVKWDKDRGKNPDGSERPNDLHYTLAQKQTARGGRA